MTLHPHCLRRLGIDHTLYIYIIMYDIQLNESGTRHLQLTEENLRTIRKYKLLEGLVGSAGFVTETELNKLRMNVRALIASSTENTKDLLDLCIDVIYHDKMKAYGLKQLMVAYQDFQSRQEENPTSEE